jgi:hypothetical protein
MGQQRLHGLVVEGELGKARALRIAFKQALALKKTAHTAGDAGCQSAELGVVGAFTQRNVSEPSRPSTYTPSRNSI